MMKRLFVIAPADAKNPGRPDLGSIHCRGAVLVGSPAALAPNLIWDVMVSNEEAIDLAATAIQHVPFGAWKTSFPALADHVEFAIVQRLVGAVLTTIKVRRSHILTTDVVLQDHLPANEWFGVSL